MNMNFTATTGAVLAVFATAALSLPAQAKWIRCYNVGGPSTGEHQLACPEQDEYGVELAGRFDFLGYVHVRAVSNPNNYQYQALALCKCPDSGCPEIPTVQGDAVTEGESVATCGGSDTLGVSGRFWVP